MHGDERARPRSEPRGEALEILARVDVGLELRYLYRRERRMRAVAHVRP